MNVQNDPFSESFFKIHEKQSDGRFLDIFDLDIFIFQIHSYL